MLWKVFPMDVTKDREHFSTATELSKHQIAHPAQTSHLLHSLIFNSRGKDLTDCYCTFLSYRNLLHRSFFFSSLLCQLPQPLICSWITSIWFESTAWKYLFVFIFHTLVFLTYLSHAGTRCQDTLSSEAVESWWACFYWDLISWQFDPVNYKADPWHMSI